MKKPTPKQSSNQMKAFERSKFDKEKYPEGRKKDKTMDKKQLPAFLKATKPKAAFRGK